MNESENLERFLEAQKPIYDQVCTELRRGKKSTHWMWFIFPQINGLGNSPYAKKYALSSLEEAQQYFKHPILGSRLKECTQLVNKIEKHSALAIFGEIDCLKFRSSMTLFAHAITDNQDFEKALQKYFSGKYDQMTVDRI